MQVRHLKVENFRGIKSLDWHINGNIICLVGPGDSTKTTILDSIEHALSSRWNIPFSDADFFNGDTENDIIVEASVSDIPDELMADDKLGLFTRGYSEEHGIIDDPEEGSIPIITIQFKISDDLEPHWYLIKESNQEPRRITWRDRDKLGMARLGEDTNIHLTWRRGSALTKILKNESKPTSALCLANRAACEALEEAPLEDFQDTINSVQESVKDFGVNIGDLRAGLDTKAVSIGTGTISLHREKVPIRGFGLGTKRLASLAIQQTGIGINSIKLIDEIEHGLEPHRIRQLLKKLCSKMNHNEIDCGQILMTTHSPTPIMFLSVNQLRFVRSKDGVTTVDKVDKVSIAALQPVVRKRGHALLGRKIIICEGKTEEALCRVFDNYWAGKHNDENFSFRGVVAVDGGGRTEGSSSAMELNRIGYDVLYFGDSDKPLVPDEKILKKTGISVVLWEGNMSTEERITADLPLKYLQDIVNIAADEFGEVPVIDAISNRLEVSITSLGLDIHKWIEKGVTEENIRSAVGLAAKKHQKGWFKNLNAGERLGETVINALNDINGKPLSKSINQIEGWIYGK